MKNLAVALSGQDPYTMGEFVGSVLFGNPFLDMMVRLVYMLILVRDF